MTYRIPFLSVSGPDGTDMLGVWGSRLVGVKVTSRHVDETDTCEFTFRNGPPYLAAPAENTPFIVAFGWSAAAATVFGVFYMHSIHLSGDPKTGDQVIYECWSGKMVGLDQAGSQHFNAENGHNTLGDVFKTVLGASGMEVVVAPTVASLPVPGGHLLQWNQTGIDFASDLANNAGAIVKAMGGKMLVLDRYAGLSVGGTPLAGVTIDKASCYSYDVTAEPRFQFSSMTVPYMDNAVGRLKQQVTSTGSDEGAKQGFPHPAEDQASAATLGKVIANEFKVFTKTGIFEIPGDPNAVSGCRPTCTGFPDPIDGTDWLAVQVEHDVEPNIGWITTVETQTDPG